MDSLFAQAIREHLELRERNAALERAMPLERYRSDDPAADSAISASEPARLDDTGELDDARLALPTADGSASPDAFDAPWGNPRAFDWGD